MWRSKKFIVITVLVAVVLVGGIGGVAFAQSGRDGHHPPGPPRHGPGAAILESFGIDREALQAAFDQARSELKEGTLEGGRGVMMMRVLEILGISEDEWQAACSEARESCSEMRPGPPPEGRPQFNHGFGFRGPGGRPHGPGGFGGPPDTQ